VQAGFVPARRETTEHLAFHLGWLREERQDLIAVAGENNLVDRNVTPKWERSMEAIVASLVIRCRKGAVSGAR
jgi:hypothetical protein